MERIFWIGVQTEIYRRKNYILNSSQNDSDPECGCRFLKKGFRQPNETNKLGRFGLNKLCLGSKQEVNKNKHKFLHQSHQNLVVLVTISHILQPPSSVRAQLRVKPVTLF